MADRLTDNGTHRLKSWFPLVFLTFIIFGATYFIGPVLKPFFWGGLLAYFMNPLVEWQCIKGVKKVIAIILVLSVICIVLFLLFVILIPQIIYQIKMLINFLPIVYEWVNGQVVNYINILSVYDVELKDSKELINNIFYKLQHSEGLFTYLISSAKNSWAFIFQLVSNIILLPIVAFYLLRDWDILRRYSVDIIPQYSRKKLLVLLNECHVVIKVFIKGRLMVMLLMGGFYSLGLAILGVRLFILVGIVSALVVIIPYMGLLLGIFTIFCLYVFQDASITQMLSVGTLFVIGQVLESWFLTPWLVENKIGLHPLVVVFSAMVGGYLLGFAGLAMALPIAAVLVVLLRHLNFNAVNSSDALN